MDKDRKIPTKNYIILAVITIIVIVLTLYINAWIKTYKDNKLSVSPFSGVIEEVNINEIGLTFSEMNEVILYVGYTNDKVVYDMEEKLLDYIKNYSLVDKFIYVNANDYKEDKKYLSILKETFPEVADSIEDVPVLIYVNNGKAVEVVNSNSKLLTTYDVSLLVDKYELEN